MPHASSIRDLQTEGFYEMTYPPELRAAVLKTARSWKRFCALPTAVKTGLPYSNDGAGVGYELKDGSGPKGDRKENFDVTLVAREWLLDNVDKIGDKGALAFVEDAVALVGLLKPSIITFAADAEQAFGIEGLAKEVEGSEDAFFIRFIHNFEGTPVGDEMTMAHPDQSAFTPHLFASAPGLERLTFDGTWIPMPASEDRMGIIPSMQLQFRSKGKLIAQCHRVVATAETSAQGRYSAVCFVQLKQTPKYNKKKFGRLQEMAAGFNYPSKMSFEQFAQLFS